MDGLLDPDPWPFDLLPSALDAPLAPQGAGILVVDDDAEHVDAVRKILEAEGYRVECAADGRIALDRLLREPLPDLVLIDLMMPVMNGSQLIAELKGRPELAAVPVVVMSGGGEQMLNSAPVSAGYLQKPLSSARFLETVDACLMRQERKKSGRRPIAG